LFAIFTAAILSVIEVGVSQVDGYSEDSSTNFGVQYTPVPWFWALVGGYVSNRYELDVPALSAPAPPAD